MFSPCMHRFAFKVLLAYHRIVIFERFGFFWHFSLNFLSQTIIPLWFILVNWYIHLLRMLIDVFQMKSNKNVLPPSGGDQSSAAVVVACWPVPGWAVTTNPASAQEHLMACQENITLFPSELSHREQCSQPNVIQSYNDENFNLFMYYFGWEAFPSSHSIFQH